MSKVKFLNKWKEENNQYSPTHEVQNIETDAYLPSDELSSPLSTYSLTFDGEKWQIPLQEEDMEEENFLPPRTSSPVPQGKYKQETFCQYIFQT